MAHNRKCSDGSWWTSEKDEGRDLNRYWKWQVLVGAPYDETEIGPTWCDFVPRIANGITDAFLKGENEFRYDCQGTLYIIDFASGKQINVRTRTAREIRRSWVSFPYPEPTFEQWVPPPPKGDGKGGKKR